MMNKLNTNLCIFDTSKGHYGRTDIYKTTVKYLTNVISLNKFNNLYVHIKVCAGEENIFQEQEKFYDSFGFNIIKSVGEWSHFSETHQKEYSKDLIKLYSLIDHTVDFSLHLESDFLFEPIGCNLSSYISLAKDYFQVNSDVFSIRFPRFFNEVDRVSKLKEKHNLSVEIVSDGPFWRHNDNISLNPTLFRTRDVQFLTRFLELNPQFQNHVEMGFGQLFKIVSRNKYPHAFFDPKLITVKHIGTRIGEEDKLGENIISD